MNILWVLYKPINNKLTYLLNNLQQTINEILSIGSQLKLERRIGFIFYCDKNERNYLLIECVWMTEQHQLEYVKTPVNNHCLIFFSTSCIQKLLERLRRRSLNVKEILIPDDIVRALEVVITQIDKIQIIPLTIPILVNKTIQIFFQF